MTPAAPQPRKASKFEQLPEEQRRQYLFAAARNGWLARNVGYSKSEYEAAMARLAKLCGVL